MDKGRREPTAFCFSGVHKLQGTSTVDSNQTLRNKISKYAAKHKYCNALIRKSHEPARAPSRALVFAAYPNY